MWCFILGLPWLSRLGIVPKLDLVGSTPISCSTYSPASVREVAVMFGASTAFGQTLVESGRPVHELPGIQA
jgi:hypothetical protein